LRYRLISDKEQPKPNLRPTKLIWLAFQGMVREG